MGKLNTKQNNVVAKTFDEMLTSSGLSDTTITLIGKYAKEEKNESKALDILNLCMAGLSFKEAELVVKHRSSRSVNVSLRMSQAEAAQLEEVETALRERGYIKEGRTDAIMFMISNFDLPVDKQLKIEVNS